MGVTFFLRKSNFFIDQAHIWDAYHTLMDWYRDHMHNPYYRDLLAANDLAEALAFGWLLDFDGEQNVVGIKDSVASISPWRAQSLIEVLTVIAPFVRAGSEVEISHDDSGSTGYETVLTYDGEGVRCQTWEI